MGIGLASLLVATWFAQTLRLSPHLQLIPKLSVLVSGDALGAVLLVVVAGVLFALLSAKLIRGQFAVPRALTITLSAISAILFIGLAQQWLEVGDQAYRIEWATTLTSITVELAALGLVWWAWFIAKRNPTAISRTCLNWLLSFYVVNVWCGGAVWLIGP